MTNINGVNINGVRQTINGVRHRFAFVQAMFLSVSANNPNPRGAE